MPSRQDRSEVERLRAALAAERAERERLTDKLAAVLDHVAAFNALPVTADGTGPVPRVQGQRGTHRTPREARWLRVVPGLALPLGLASAIRRATGAAHLSTPAVSAAALSAAVVVSLGHAHNLPYDTPYTGSVPSASSPADPDPVLLPPSRLSARSTPKPLAVVKVKVPVRLPFKALVVPAPTPAPIPVATPVVAVSSQPQGTSWSGSDTSSQPSSSYQSSDSSRSSDWQQQPGGRHRAYDSGEGNSSYQGRHGGQNNSQGNYWQDGSQQGNQQGGSWQNGQQQGGQQDASWQGSQQSGTWQGSGQQGTSWQGGSSQNGHWQGGQQQGGQQGNGQAGQQQGGGWQGNGGGHGNHGGR